jgi:hypothetical protein
MSQELYPEHKEQAIAEFTRARLKSYYAAHTDVLVPAARMFKESKVLAAAGHHSAGLVFAASATELFLKAALLRPVVYGLVHSEALAELVASAALSQAGFTRYEKLLSKLFLDLTGTELRSIVRIPCAKPLLEEASDIQDLRNAVVHRGAEISADQAQLGVAVATEVFNKVLAEVITTLGFSMQKGGILVDAEA